MSNGPTTLTADHDYLMWFNNLDADTKAMVRRNLRQKIDAYDRSDCWHYYGSPCTLCERHQNDTHRAALIGA